MSKIGKTKLKMKSMCIVVEENLSSFRVYDV